ncbi:beta-lactamase family protein [Kitasatospora purpeofusca]|uniref:serine hydrolase domain-containing protein n=1 Tax=Kitasatospora purpeofusca TaxID=67352 RepID=UPI002257AD6B|nr:serine hydrolase domain-containing protein [Kitasatospora purpeofusca]MCX4689757.1 beta-lactamase family protein [Kitasatospora purpeofusca]
MNAHRCGVPEVADPGISILVRRPGEAAVQLHTGLANLEHAVPIGPDTAFNVGSVAKQITAHLVLLAVQDGLLALDQSVNALLPRLQVRDITITDLITHRSGLRDAESLLSLAGFRDLDHYTADDLVNLAYRQQQGAVPEDQFLYSNTNYLLLAKILETVHGINLADLARTCLFVPLGMTATHFKTDPRQLIPHAACAYQPTSDGWQHTARPAALPGPGTLWTTPTDLDRWLGHLADRWHQAGLGLPDQDVVPYRAADHAAHLYGVGLYADARPAQRGVFHYGHEHGFSAAAHLAATGARVVCMSNSDTIAADRVAATLCIELRGNHIGDLEGVLARAAEEVSVASRDPSRANRDSAQPDIASHTGLGTFLCTDVPGTLRLTRKRGALYLWRRGRGDQLVSSGPLSHAGPGYRLTMRPAGRHDAAPDGFTLDLDRAPGLYFKRQ